MCAIGGFIDKKNALSLEDKISIANSFLSILKHRGGDGSGIYVKENIVLIHNRLSIIDTSEKSNQPIFDEEAVLSYNGEIYNYKDFDNIKSHSDSVFLFEYLKSGFDIKKLDGMFAYSYLDLVNNIVKLQVDRFGIKPLYLYEDEDYFAWGSELKAFECIPTFKSSFNDEKLTEYLLYRSISSSDTLIKNIYKLLPGESLLFDVKAGLKSVTEGILSMDEVNQSVFDKSEVFNLIEESVKNNLISDVPIGVQLSGGIDSTIIALESAKHVKNLRTYSIGLEDSSWNEFAYSDLIVEKINSTHKKITFTKQDFINSFRKLTYHLDGPIVHPNTIPIYLLAKEARKDVKVLLTGEGADELLGGYKRYKSLELKEDFNLFNSHKLVESILLNKKLNLKRKGIFNSYLYKSNIKQYSAYDIKTYLPEVLLRQDKASMAANIESRVPFLSNNLSEVLFNLKDSLKVGQYGQKNILKDFLKERHGLEGDFLTREKCGFGLPIQDWLTDDLVFLEDLKNLEHHELLIKYFKLDNVRSLVSEQIYGKKDNSGILFTLISLVTWYDVFIKNKDF